MIDSIGLLNLSLRQKGVVIGRIAIQIYRHEVDRPELGNGRVSSLQGGIVRPVKPS